MSTRCAPISLVGWLVGWWVGGWVVCLVVWLVGGLFGGSLVSFETLEHYCGCPIDSEDEQKARQLLGLAAKPRTGQWESRDAYSGPFLF